ncbi:hypothetical protein ACEPPN_017884 [Leptodophora sp. 'Broadleaf-Isolate-01']
MQLSSILFLAIQAAGVLSAPSAGNEGDAPDLANSSLPPPGTLWERYSDQKLEDVSQVPLSGAISARSAAGKFAVMVDSGAGLLVAMEVDPGTLVVIGDSAASSRAAARTAIMLMNADAAVRRL